MSLRDFAESVGSSGPVWVQGHQTRIPAPAGVRTVTAPRGITLLRAEEMVVECGAGTPIDEVQAALAEVGQYVNLPTSPVDSGTVGGALALGHSDLRRLGRGAARDAVLRIRFVGHDGEPVTAGGSTVKNVSGFDLCRLLIGSRGTLGFFGEILLRTRPLPQFSAWFEVPADATAVRVVAGTLYRPAALLWNGAVLWMCLEGHPADVDDALERVGAAVGARPRAAESPDMTAFPHRWTLSPRRAEALVEECSGRCWAEVGVGTVHHSEPPPSGAPSPEVAVVERRLLETFDPTGRLNPGLASRYGATADH